MLVGTATGTSDGFSDFVRKMVSPRQDRGMFRMKEGGRDAAPLLRLPCPGVADDQFGS